jgi:hypothetical protein
VNISFCSCTDSRFISGANSEISAAKITGDEKVIKHNESKLVTYYTILDLIYREFDKNHLPEQRHGEKLLEIRENERLRGITHGNRDNAWRDFMDDIDDAAYNEHVGAHVSQMFYSDEPFAEPEDVADERRFAGYL